MLSSIVLLLALQVFWLDKAYESERENFQKQTHLLFRNVIFDMSDSLLFKSIKPVKGDSGGTIVYFSNDTSKVHSNMRVKSVRIRDTSNVTVLIKSTSDRDSVDLFLKPLVSHIRNHRSEKKFSIRLSPDSLHKKDIEAKFQKALASSGILVPFDITVGNPVFPPSHQPLNSDPVIYSPTGSFRVDFPDLKYVVLKRIAPQILFSVFLTLLTVASFAILYRSMRLQQRLMDLKNDFISNVAHELKTPVTTVGVALEALKNFKGLENPKLTEEYLDIAQKELSRLSILTDKILKTAIFENKGVDFQPEEVAFDQLVEEVLASMKLVFEKQNVQISFTKEGEGFEMMGGPVHLTSVIYNLLENAIKYSSSHPQIQLLLKADPHSIIFSIRDNGIGIPTEYQKKIFEKFARVPTGDVHTIKGYGLGLNYVDQVVKAHKGKIEVESKPGAGSKFTITFPHHL